MSTRPYDLSPQGASRPIVAGALAMPLMVVGFAVGVTLLFALAVGVVLDASVRIPASVVVQSSFAARTDSTVPYAPSREMTIKPQRSVVLAERPASDD